MIDRTGLMVPSKIVPYYYSHILPHSPEVDQNFEARQTSCHLYPDMVLLFTLSGNVQVAQMHAFDEAEQLNKS